MKIKRCGSQAFPARRIRAASVAFEPGAHTAWHSHPLGGTLIVSALVFNMFYRQVAHAEPPTEPQLRNEFSLTSEQNNWRASATKTSASTAKTEVSAPQSARPLKAVPVLRSSKYPTPGAPPVGVFRVALDIGHTARSGGAVSASGVMEYVFNKEAAKTMASQLAALPGVEPFVVDESGGPISLPERAIRANAAGAGLFLAVHHDSANDRYLLPVKVGKRTFHQTTRFRGYSVFYSEKNRFSAESARFARALGAAMRRHGLAPTLHHAEQIPGENRQLIEPELGVYRFDDLIVLKRANMPAALLECGVIVNPDEEQELRQPGRRLQTAKAVAEAVTELVSHLQQQSDIKHSNPTQ